MATTVVVEAEITTDVQRTLIEVVKKLNFPFPVRVVSGSRREPGSNHDYGTARAIDLAVGHSPLDNDDSLKMRVVAKALLKYAHLLDPDANDDYGMIHSTNFSDDNGFVVLSGVHQPGTYDPVHVDHIHLATTLARAQLLLRAIPGTTTPVPVPTTPSPGGTVATDAEWVKIALDKGVRTGGTQTNPAPGGGSEFSMFLRRELEELKDQNAELKVLLQELVAKLDAPRTYVVVSGDTLSEIAGKYNTTVDELKRLNGLASDVIRPGDVLRVK